MPQEDSQVQQEVLLVQIQRVENLLTTREFSQAFRKADISLRDRLKISGRMLFKGFRQAFAAEVLQVIAEVQGYENASEVAAIGDGDLLRLIIENLPAIIEAILKLISALS